MSESADELEAYLRADEELKAAARKGDLMEVKDVELRWADAAEIYANGLERDGHAAPAGLRDQISDIRQHYS